MIWNIIDASFFKISVSENGFYKYVITAVWIWTVTHFCFFRYKKWFTVAKTCICLAQNCKDSMCNLIGRVCLFKWWNWLDIICLPKITVLHHINKHYPSIFGLRLHFFWNLHVYVEVGEYRSLNCKDHMICDTFFAFIDIHL